MSRLPVVSQFPIRGFLEVLDIEAVLRTGGGGLQPPKLPFLGKVPTILPPINPGAKKWHHIFNILYKTSCFKILIQK